MMLLGLLLGVSLPVAQPVDRIEVNHTRTFTQVVLWQWSHDYNRYDCAGYWVTDKIHEMPTQNGGQWTVMHDGKRYSSKQVVETFTRNDPERDNARLFPQSMRCLR
jgi:hypothetical protein